MMQDGHPHRFTPETIRKRLLSLGKWFHNMDLMGVQTAPTTSWATTPPTSGTISNTPSPGI